MNSEELSLGEWSVRQDKNHHTPLLMTTIIYNCTKRMTEGERKWNEREKEEKE